MNVTTSKEFIEKLKTIRPDVRALEEYKGYNTKIKFLHIPCNCEYITTPTNVLNTKTCPKCVYNTNSKNLKLKDRIGEESYTTFGSKMTIVEYKKCSDITVEFDNGYRIKTRYTHFKDGLIRYPYDKTVYGVGYLGEYDNKYNPLNKNSCYEKWRDMLCRCYDTTSLTSHPTYKDVIVCKEWLSFDKFSKWFENNYYIIEGERMHLDKDILIKGNKIYSPETCVFVPQIINLLFIKRDANRGDLPIGVTQIKNRKKKYFVNVSNKRFMTIEEAFNSYKEFKENYIKQIAYKYKDKIPERLYIAMINYQVEITD